MELSELTKEMVLIFKADDIASLPEKLMRSSVDADHEAMAAFIDLVGELNTDHLQAVYQYYFSDREEKKQDFTPKCIARLLSVLIGESTEVIDMCAGTGALTIQRWADASDTAFTLFEIDEVVIPFLIFNLTIRNIRADVFLGDVLSQEIKRHWRVEKGEMYGKVVVVESAV